MIGLLVASALVALIVIAATSRPQALASLEALGRRDGDVSTDLPCPWCHAQTSESDRRCPSCGQRFG